MAVKHGVVDNDKHFVIDPVTRTIKNQSGKLVLIQYDHNSERFTFECPRHVDGHDMSLCNKVEIHYINTGTGNAKSTGVYEADDLQTATSSGEVVTFSWLISQNATQHVGKLNFVIRFACVTDEAIIEYAWNTGIYSDIVISKSIYNGEEFVEDYIDVLEAWKQDLYSEGLKINTIEQTTTSTDDSGINIVTVTMTDGSTRTFQIQNGSKGTPGTPGTPGAPGVSISTIERTSGDGSAGSLDTYTITMTDGSTSTFQVRNGSNGSDGDGSGDMTTATYDPQGKRTDIFKYVDDAVDNSSSNVSITVDDALSETSENPVQNKVVTSKLADKQAKAVGVEIVETICENITFDDSNPTYTLPSSITIDSDALYYIDCYYYDGSITEGVNTGYSIHAISRELNNTVKWASSDDSSGITFDGSTITNNWRDPGAINVISIHKVNIVYTDRLLTEVMRTNGYRAVAPGGYYANAEGYYTMASGYAAHSEGNETYAFGNFSHTEGQGVIAGSNYQHVQGKYNVEDYNGVYVHIVGNGSSDTERSNAHTLDWSGNAWFAGNITSKQTNVTEQVSADNGTNKIAIWPNGIAGDEIEGTDESKLWIGSDGVGYFEGLYIGSGTEKTEVATKADITAAITGAIEGSY